MAFRGLEGLGFICDGVAAIESMRMVGKDALAADTLAVIFRRPLTMGESRA